MRTEIRHNAVAMAIMLILLATVVYLAGFRAGIQKTSAVSSFPLTSAEIPAKADDLTLPIWGVKYSQILDTFNHARPGGRRHEATDILAPRGTPIHAVTDGVVRKLLSASPGGNTLYQFDSAGVYCYHYAQLGSYANDLREGQKIKKGEIIGYVGTAGDADPDVPHLHFAILKLGPEKEWWKGTPINPYPILEQIARSEVLKTRKKPGLSPSAARSLA